MRKLSAGIIVLVAALFVASFARSDESEESAGLSFADLPQAVRAAAEKIFGAGTEFSVEAEDEDGVKEYEVEAPTLTGKASAEFTEAGELLEMETETSLEKVPVAVQQALAREYPAAQVDKAEKVETHFYEFDLTVAGVAKEVKVSPSGSFIDDDDDADDNDEDEGDDDDDDDDDGDDDDGDDDDGDDDDK